MGRLKCLRHRLHQGDDFLRRTRAVLLNVVLKRQAKQIDVGIHVLVFFAEGVEISPAVVELHHLFQR